MTEQSILTVSELNRHVKSLLDGDAGLQRVCVQGELSNYKVYPSGHHYFNLKDAESTLPCVMFRSSTARLRFRPDNGMKVTAFGQVTAYLRDGAYKLYCTHMAPEGLGELYAAFEQLKQKLASEGLFDPARKKPIPRFPRRIAVVTSGAGDAVRDIIRVAGKRWPMAKIIVLPVRVQGPEAPPEIVGALRYANRWKVGDLIITGRGGGSVEQLWAFNDERVVRAIAASELPVISAVGHEPDVTIADYAADLRAATPTHAAELATPDARKIRTVLEDDAARCNHALRRQLELYRRRLDALRTRRVMESPLGYIELKRMELDLLQGRLLRCRETGLADARRRFVRSAAALDALSPLKVLSRGYAVAEDGDGGVIRSVADTAAGERIRVLLGDGALGCTVDAIIEEEETGHGRERTEL